MPVHRIPVDQTLYLVCGSKMAAGTALQTVRQIMSHVTKGNSFDRVCNKVRVLSADSGRVTCEMTVEEEHQNLGGTLHGGLTATLVDTISTWALMTTGSGAPGVSVDMSIAYMKAAGSGEEIIIDANTLRAGRTLAFLTVDIKRKSDGVLLAQGKHTKFIGHR